MTWWQPDNFAKKHDFLRARGSIIRGIRRFFDMQGFEEVQTPILQVCPVIDAHIHGFKTQLKDIDLKDKATLYLHTSPEFSMKKLLAAGMEKIYQICPVFRNAEGSSRHRPEFTMIEWYRINSDYRAMMDDCEDLLRALAQEQGVKVLRHGNIESDPFAPWERLSVSGAFQKFADIDLDACLENRDVFVQQANQAGISVRDQDNWDDIFFSVMARKIEPHLGESVPCILYDYPLCLASLSKPSAEAPNYAERFELYVCGVELANAFSELTDAKEQKRRYEIEMQIKEKYYGERYPLDEDFIAALESGLPPSSGIALGVDRLVMLMTGASDIKDVIWAES